MDPGTGAIQSGEPPQARVPVRADVAWPIGVQLALVVLVTATLFFLLGRWSQGSNASHTEPVERAGPALNLNRATKAELRLVPGLGESLAQRVIEHRQRYGAFHSLDELRLVSGVGPKTLERVRPHLFVQSDELPVALDDEEMAPPRPAKPVAGVRSTGPSKKELHLSGPINVNRANQAELQKLPGIGPKISQRMLEERARGAFKSIEDLRRVSGIGPKTLEKLRPYVTID